MYIIEANGISVKAELWREGAKALIEKIARTEGTAPLDFEVVAYPNGSSHIVENYRAIDENGQKVYDQKNWGPITVNPIEDE